MTSRREFLQIGFGAAAAAPVASLAAVPQQPASGPLPLYKVVYDVRFPSSIAFARRAAAQGLATHATQGDITRFWYHELYHRWANSPVAIAGLTGYGALFCLERLAWDQRLRVVFRAEHAPLGRRVAHGFAGPAGVLPAACDGVAGDDWAARMADIVAACPAGRGVGAEADVRTMSAGVMAERETLYSWVIAAPLRA